MKSYKNYIKPYKNNIKSYKKQYKIIYNNMQSYKIHIKSHKTTSVAILAQAILAQGQNRFMLKSPSALGTLFTSPVCTRV